MTTLKDFFEKSKMDLLGLNSDVWGLILARLTSWELARFSQTNRRASQLVNLTITYQNVRQVLQHRKTAQDQFEMFWGQKEFDTAIRLFSHYRTNIDLRAHQDWIFIWVCSHGPARVVEWVYLMTFSFNREINLSFDEELFFRMACFNGRLDTAKWLLDIKPSIRVQARNNFAFNFACGEGHLDVIQWLVQVEPSLLRRIQPHVVTDAFQKACIYNYIHIARWLYDMFPRFISRHHKQLVLDYCRGKMFNPTIDWLSQLSPTV